MSLPSGHFLVLHVRDSYDGAFLMYRAHAGGLVGESGNWNVLWQQLNANRHVAVCHCASGRSRLSIRKCCLIHAISIGIASLPDPLSAG